MMAERGITRIHTTILRWEQRYVPEFEMRWNPYARPVGDSWRVDETYLKMKDQWVYLYRAVDKAGRTVDFLLSRRRDIAAAKRFFSRAAKQHGVLRVITLDGYADSHRGRQTERGLERYHAAYGCDPATPAIMVRTKTFIVWGINTSRREYRDWAVCVLSVALAFTLSVPQVVSQRAVPQFP